MHRTFKDDSLAIAKDKRIERSLGFSLFSCVAVLKISGIPMRTIQQYEQRQKNINKAKAEYVVMLAKTLFCTGEDLIEKCECE